MTVDSSFFFVSEISPLFTFSNRLGTYILLRFQKIYFNMFSSNERLEKRTPKEGINREEYIRLLADEYYETTDIGKLINLVFLNCLLLFYNNTKSFQKQNFKLLPISQIFHMTL